MTAGTAGTTRIARRFSSSVWPAAGWPVPMTRRTTTPERTTRRPTTRWSLACSRERAGDGATSISVSS